MAQRFTATEKWSDPWFRELAPASKLGYLYLLDRCDHAGIIDFDEKLAEFCIGCSVDWQELFASDRLHHIEGTKYWLAKFCQFQYRKGLNDGSQVHSSVIGLLEKHKLTSRLPEGFINPCQRVKDKYKDKDKAKSDRGGMGGNFERWWSTVPNKVGKQAARKAYEKAAKRLSDAGSEDAHGFLLDRMTAFAASPKARGDFCPHPATWLNEGRYEDDPATWQGSSKPKGIFS